jgi:hypothetical protein
MRRRVLITWQTSSTMLMSLSTVDPDPPLLAQNSGGRLAFSILCTKESPHQVDVLQGPHHRDIDDVCVTINLSQNTIQTVLQSLWTTGGCGETCMFRIRGTSHVLTRLAEKIRGDILANEQNLDSAERELALTCVERSSRLSSRLSQTPRQPSDQQNFYHRPQGRQY